MLRYWLAFLLACVPPLAQVRTPEDNVYRVGPGVSPPKLLRKTEPTYNEQARSAQVQGTVCLEIVVNEHGRAQDILVVSPIGFGLDERAQEAIAKWEFQPGRKDGKPVKIRAVVEVNFHFPQIWFDQKAEDRRTEYNLALRSLQLPDQKRSAHGLETIQRLSEQHYPAAMHLEALLLEAGQLLPKDPARALQLLMQAADKHYGPALYEMGIRYREGRGVPLDSDKGLSLIRDASVLGSVQAQLLLGDLYAKGKGVPEDAERARRYFRLCASAGIADCQYRLGEMMLSARDRAERDYVQGIAWLELASDAGSSNAKELLEEERPKLTTEQFARVKEWKPKLTPNLRPAATAAPPQSPPSTPANPA